MKMKTSVACGILLAAIIAGMLAFRPVPDSDSGMASSQDGGDPAIVNAGESSGAAEDEGAESPQEEAAEVDPAMLLQKYAESESQRQKEIEDARLPVFVPPPLVMLDPLPPMGLNETQTRKLAALRQSFIDGIAKLDKDPASPEYMEHWMQERERLDDEVRLHLGQEVFLQLSAWGFAALQADKSQRR